jgi:hypothetical protein
MVEQLNMTEQSTRFALAISRGEIDGCCVAIDEEE